MAGAVPQHQVTQYAHMLGAMGSEPRLRIVRLLLAAHPKGLTAGDVGNKLDITPSTLSHHLERLRREHVVNVRRNGTFLWYTANAEALENLLRFLFAECCTSCCQIDPARLTGQVTSHKSQGPSHKIEESSS